MDTDLMIKAAYNIEDMDDAVSFLQSIPRFLDASPEKHFKQSKAFYDQLFLEDPDRHVFHIAGTNGKGSVCAFLASIHRHMGIRVGVFTSPHLCDIRERIVMDGEMIKEEDFIRHLNLVLTGLEKFRHTSGMEDYFPLYFDWLFFIAASYFGEKRPDCVIWETGLGGRLDAVNTIDKKDVTVITEIGLDHMEYLGDTREKIAFEKAGIIRSGVPVVTVDRYTGVSEVIRSQADKIGAPLAFVPGYEKIQKSVCDKVIDFSYESDYYNNATFEVVGPAVYQTENATLAIKAMEIVYGGENIPKTALKEGLKEMRWPGRLEEIDKNIFYDGAHNVDGIKALLDSVSHDGCRGVRSMLFSAVTDKQSDRELKMIADSKAFGRLILAPMHTGRSVDVEGLKDRAKAISDSGDSLSVDVRDVLTEAYKELKAGMGEYDHLYVCGSLYIYEELKAAD